MNSKIIIILFVTILIFMIKLPLKLHHYDKELHTSAWLLVILVCSSLQKSKTLLNLILLAIVLWFTGVTVECLQQYSNTLFHKSLHGKFDIQDIKANTIGLIIGTFISFIFRINVFVLPYYK